MRDFVLLWEPIFRRPALNDIADINLFALEAHGFNHLREQFSRAADKWKALNVFVVPGTLADKNEFSVRIAVGKDDVRSGLVKLAACAFAKIFTNLKKRIACNLVDGLE
jgi:hypothetical protein